MPVLATAVARPASNSPEAKPHPLQKCIHTWWYRVELEQSLEVARDDNASKGQPGSGERDARGLGRRAGAKQWAPGLAAMNNEDSEDSE